ncbi:hypothetical protein PVAND_000866 [Polypedilum vanderplanki]|uniref:Ganglioside GM2 activator n=1 Tax=Polypedilum vanderplanki TaxID=319348 RepID=A0A9J6BL64_POLVA|nr:hypothetical protein PVAND_000866 [Polypedilum vanderplanki]
MLLHLLLLILFSLNLASPDGIFQSSGSGQHFEVSVDHFEILYEDKSLSEWIIKIRRVNKTRAIFGKVLVHVPYGNDYKVGLKVLKKQGGEYRYLPYRFPNTPFCDAAATDKYIYPEIVKNSDLPDDMKKNCPLEIGNYTLNGIIPNTENAPKIILPSGEYSAEVSFYNSEDKITSTFRFYATIINV